MCNRLKVIPFVMCLGIVGLIFGGAALGVSKWCEGSGRIGWRSITLSVGLFDGNVCYAGYGCQSGKLCDNAITAISNAPCTASRAAIIAGAVGLLLNTIGFSACLYTYLLSKSYCSNNNNNNNNNGCLYKYFGKVSACVFYFLGGLSQIIAAAAWRGLMNTESGLDHCKSKEGFILMIIAGMIVFIGGFISCCGWPSSNNNSTVIKYTSSYANSGVNGINAGISKSNYNNNNNYNYSYNYNNNNNNKIIRIQQQPINNNSVAIASTRSVSPSKDLPNSNNNNNNNNINNNNNNNGKSSGSRVSPEPV